MRSILSLRDIEAELLLFLRSFVIPTFDDIKRQFRTEPTIKIDPNEIDIDCPNSNETVVKDKSVEATSFESYGVGSLAAHPLLRSCFSSCATISARDLNTRNSWITASTVLAALEFQLKLSKRSIDDLTVRDIEQVLNIESFNSAGIAINYPCLQQNGVWNLARGHAVQSFERHMRDDSSAYCQSDLGPMEENIATKQIDNKRKRRKGVDTRVTDSQLLVDNIDVSDESNLLEDDKRSDPSDNRTALRPNSRDICNICLGKVDETYLKKNLSSSENIVEGINFDGKLVFASIPRTERLWRYEVDSKDTNFAASVIYCSNNSDKMTARETGRWGEAFVFNYLKNKYPDAKITWMNEIEETRASYDISMFIPDKGSSNQGSTIFIEVKSTRSKENNVCELSLLEWQFATSLPKVQVNIVSP